MNWDAIGALAEMIGAAAVFGSLIYLAVQIRHSSNHFRAQIEDELQTRAFQAYDPFYEGQNADIVDRGLSGEELVGGENLTFDLLMHRQLAVIQTVSQRAESGHLDPELLDGYISHFRLIFVSRPGGRKWVENHIETMPGDIREEARERLLGSDP